MKAERAVAVVRLSVPGLRTTLRFRRDAALGVPQTTKRGTRT